MPAIGIRLQLAIGSVAVLALFAANLTVHAWAGAKRDDALARLRHAVDRRAAVVAVQRDLDDRWREADVLQHVTLTADHRHALGERLRALHGHVEALVSGATDQEQPIADAFLREWTALFHAWVARYDHDAAAASATQNAEARERPSGPASAEQALPNPDQAMGRLLALSGWNERVAALAVDELGDVTAFTDRFSVTVFLLTMFAVSVGMAGMWRRLSRGVQVLAEGAGRFGRGELDHRIVLRRKDELGHLALAFNGMAASLELARGEAEAARDMAERASRAKGRFLTNITHDFRTPLTAILGYAELIRDEAAANDLPGIVADTRHLDAAGRHMLSLVNELLDIARADSGRMPLNVDTFDVREVIDDVVAALDVLAATGRNQLEVDVAPDVGVMTSDAMKLRQGLFNLVGNAAKFTAEGAIALRVARVTLDAGDRLQFVVSDTGIGIPADRIDRIFDEFEQGDASVARTHGGSGLGLAITRRFCRLMGGDVTVTSDPGRGTTFVVDLPATAPSAASETPTRLVGPRAVPDAVGVPDRHAG